MDRDKVISFFKKNRPSFDEIKTRFSLTKIGKGLFRDVYAIDDLVVKIPRKSNLETDHTSNLYHAREEIRQIIRIRKMKKYRLLRPFLPEIHYFDQKSGILLMPFYVKPTKKEAEVAAEILSRLAREVGHHSGGDIHDQNVMYDFENETYVIVDLGYF
jgi:hypothetical protein